MVSRPRSTPLEWYSTKPRLLFRADAERKRSGRARRQAGGDDSIGAGARRHVDNTGAALGVALILEGDDRALRAEQLHERLEVIAFEIDDVALACGHLHVILTQM